MLRRALLAIVLGLAAWTLADRPLVAPDDDAPGGTGAAHLLASSEGEPDDAQRWWDASHHVSATTLDGRTHAPLPLVTPTRFGLGTPTELRRTAPPPPSHAPPHLLDIPLLI